MSICSYIYVDVDRYFLRVIPHVINWWGGNQSRFIDVHVNHGCVKSSDTEQTCKVHHSLPWSNTQQRSGLNLCIGTSAVCVTLVPVFTPQGELAYVKRQSEEKDQRISELEESLTGTSLLVRTGIAQHLAYVCTIAKSVSQQLVASLECVGNL